MTSIDELREQAFADQDPQFQNEEVFNESEWFYLLDEASNYIDEAISAIQKANEMNRFKGAGKIERLLSEAFSRLEEEC